MKELDKLERLALEDAGDCALLDRIAKVGQDPFAVFQMTWGTEDSTAKVDVFGVAIVGHGHTIALDGPRVDWKLTLTKALDIWDEVEVKGRMSDTVWSASGRACPFARRRAVWEPTPYHLVGYRDNPFPRPADTGMCGDWCQLFDDELLECRLLDPYCWRVANE